ncbi:hypothetical protein SAMN05880574_13611 [Chryseobacterium sp. RU37D]|uniref:hypothetical protein n=1 Tax=Chryseobacterium sp. RU37D TaxID=1907397 RepID=UPI000957188E|nr:hypothetical protein [Chryseobacterium sp. RU37D]SIQ93604.1 hypothetical protein SAMN05880574_13611 [Chryseobacterium sp. RU37D]
MKKSLLILALVTAVVSMNSCKQNETHTEAKIDFTKSYETAALALADAQKKYDEAVSTNIPEKIEAAKMQLQSAQEKYLESKKGYVAKGGEVNSKYENYLKTSTQTLKNAALGIVSGKPVQEAGKIVNGAVNTIANNQVTKTVESGVKTTVSKTESGLKKTGTEVKRTTTKGINTVKKGLNSIF